MRFISIILIAALTAPLPALAAPTDAQIAQARRAYIDGRYDDAFEVLQEAADAGNGIALNILGAAYEDGRGVVQDAAKAAELFEQAADAGEIRARYNLGSLFAFGSGDIPMDRARAEQEFQMAAAAGYAPAMTALGQMSESAQPPDHKRAADWYEKGHDAGDVVATANLGHAHVKGQGRRKNWARARLLYTEAAARGYPRAFNDLGVMHEQGYGVHADSLTAFSFFIRGVEKGYPRAGINLAELIAKARFPFASKDMALGYCYWGMERASEVERAEFVTDCAALEAVLEPDEGIRARARNFANGL